jgi:hypothetical protein
MHQDAFYEVAVSYQDSIALPGFCSSGRRAVARDSQVGRRGEGASGMRKFPEKKATAIHDERTETKGILRGEDG